MSSEARRLLLQLKGEMDALLDENVALGAKRDTLADAYIERGEQLDALRAALEGLVAGLSPNADGTSLMSSLEFYCGPNARTAVSRESSDAVLRLRDALAAARVALRGVNGLPSTPDETADPA